jgi:hypothetical protein
MLCYTPLEQQDSLNNFPQLGDKTSQQYGGLFYHNENQTISDEGKENL